MPLRIGLIVTMFACGTFAVQGFLDGEKHRHSLAFLAAVVLSWVAARQLQVTSAETMSASIALSLFGLLAMTMLLAAVFARALSSQNKRQRSRIHFFYLLGAYLPWVLGFILRAYDVYHPTSG